MIRLRLILLSCREYRSFLFFFYKKIYIKKSVFRFLQFCFFFISSFFCFLLLANLISFFFIIFRSTLLDFISYRYGFFYFLLLPFFIFVLFLSPSEFFPIPFYHLFFIVSFFHSSFSYWIFC